VTVENAGPAEAGRARLSVAFCPSAPLLLPVVAGRAVDATADLRAACAEAVGALLAASPEVVVVVGAAPGVAPGVRYGAGDAGTLRGFGIPADVPFESHVRPGGRRLPLAHTVGAWLLREAGCTATRLGVAPDDLAAALAGLPGPTGVLVVGDGSARRTVKAPGYLDPAAGRFDAGVAAALAAGDAAALAALDPAEGERLLADGVPAWRAVGQAVTGRPVTACLRYDDAPFGVGYLVADWAVA
jgi:hypothetical protein